MRDTQKIANESLEMAKENKETIEKKRIWNLLIWWVLIPAILGTGTIIGLLKYRKYR